MRVLMISPELPRADVANVKTMAPTLRQFESLRAFGFTVDVVDMWGIPKLKYLQVLPRIRRLAKQADVIHAHYGYCGWLGRIAPAFSGAKAPLVISFMGSDLLGSPYNAAGDLEWFSKLMVRANKRLAIRADAVIVKSQQMAEVIAPAHSTVIPNGVDVDAFRPMDRGEARRQLNLPLDRRMVLFPGNPADPRKGHELASAATEIASRRWGEPIDLVPLWRVDPQNVATYMNACDVMLMTSLLEGSPNVVKEAMACDTRVIGVPVGDVEQLLDSVLGCELCPRDPETIAAAILRAFSLPLVAARDAIFQQGLDLKSVAGRIAKVYQQALGRDLSLPELHALNDGSCHAMTNLETALR